MQIILAILIGILIGITMTCFFFRKNSDTKSKQEKRNNKMLNILNQWLILKHGEMKVAELLQVYDVKTVVIYGMGMLGRHLIRELENTDIEVLYALDRRDMEPFHNVVVRKWKNTVIEADAVINTVLLDEKEVESMLKKYYKGRIFNLESLIFESYRVDEREA